MVFAMVPAAPPALKKKTGYLLTGPYLSNGAVFVLVHIKRKCLLNGGNGLISHYESPVSVIFQQSSENYHRYNVKCEVLQRSVGYQGMGDNVDVFMEFLSRLSNKFLSRIFEIFIICFCRHISKDWFFG